MEVTFDASNFQHITGFETSIAPQHFWSKLRLPQGYEYLPLPKMPVKDIPADTVSVEPEVAQQDEKKEEREILSAIITYKDIEWNDDHILKKLVQRFGLKEDEALEYMIKAG